MQKCIDVYAKFETSKYHHTGYILVVTSKEYFDDQKDYDNGTGRYFSLIEKRLNKIPYFEYERGNNNIVIVCSDAVENGIIKNSVIEDTKKIGINLIFNNEEFDEYCIKNSS